MPARLTLQFATAPAREQVLPEAGETVVGRGPECGVVIEDDRVSRRHAALAPGPSGWTAADLGGSVGAVERALVTGRTVVSADVRGDLDLAARESVVLGGIRALLCVPIQVLDRRIGVMYADSRQPGVAFTELDVEILEAL